MAESLEQTVNPVLPQVRKGDLPMKHSPLYHLGTHEIIPCWVDGMPAWCEDCGATLTDSEVDAINGPGFAHHLEDAQQLVNDIRNAEIDAANLRLVEGPGPA